MANTNNLEFLGREGLTTLLSQVNTNTANIKQADWNQNDPQASDYIKNRTHYESLNIESYSNSVQIDYGYSEDDFRGPITKSRSLAIPVDKKFTIKIVSIGHQDDVLDEVEQEYAAGEWDGISGYLNEESVSYRITSDGDISTTVYRGGASQLEVTVIWKEISVEVKQLDAKYIPIDNETIITENGILKTGVIHKGYTQGSVQAGNNTYAGCKGWYIVGLSSDYKSVVLDCYNGVNHASGNIYGILDDLTSSEFYDGGESTGYEAGDIVTIFNDKHYAYCNTIASVDHNVIYFTEPLPFTKLVEEGVSGRIYEADHVLYVPAKPDCGYIITYEEDGTSHEMFEGAFAFGNGSVAAAEDGFAVGQNNVVIDDHGAVFGRNNISGYANIVGGGWNNSTGQHSFVLGRNLTNTGNQNIVGGRYSTVGGTGHVVTGYRQTVTGELNAVFGGSSTEGEGNVVSGSANLVAGRKNTVQGTGQFVSGSTNVANGNFNIVGGELNNTNGQRDVLLIGKGLSANGYYQIVSGRYNNPSTKLVSNAALVIGGGTSTTDLQTTFAVDLTGEVKTVGNITTSKTLTAATAKITGDTTCYGSIRAFTNLISGSSNNTVNNSNKYNLIVGDQNAVYAKTAGGIGRHIVSGNSNSVGTTTKDIYATLTAGQGLKTNYDYQTVVGKYNTAENKAFIIGNGSSTTRSNAFTVGWDGLVSSINISNSGNIVVGTSSVPANKRNLLVGDGHSIVKADGVTPKSSGNGGNVMIGNANVIGGTDDNQYCNLVAGEHNFVTGCYQSVFGKYSAGDTSAYLIVGNGSSLNDRRNAFTVRTDGTVSVGSDPIGSMDVVTKHYLEEVLLNGEW